MGDLSAVESSAELDKALIVTISATSPTAVEIAETLLAAGADAVRTRGLAGAAINCSPAMVELFLHSGSDPNQQYNGKSAAVYAVECLDRQSRVARTFVDQLKAGGVELCSLELLGTDRTVAVAVRQGGQFE